MVSPVEVEQIGEVVAVAELEDRGSVLGPQPRVAADGRVDPWLIGKLGTVRIRHTARIARIAFDRLLVSRRFEADVRG